ncbi:TetR family transcriptional regulator [Longibacter salinarum]|uniref:TetR family transcriptional regulator n=1 Tax=Longibacter salinarum TaxID=1850348 RepID=A0A2A8CUD9_9BACT|nr:TetR/AcrR family transcriptional regulator [Longibacter salinarum]PEN11373.1 TetR family transcriptional regulator [Longibacter salinarum]
MPRTKEFDPDAVLDRAMCQFWEEGYERTSVQDLVEATGLSRSSLYETFGNKHELYLAALDRYRDRETKQLVERLEDGSSPLSCIRSVFEDARSACAGDDGRGCFVVNATVERARCDEDIGRRTAASLQGMENAFAMAVRRGQTADEVDASLDPVAAGRFLANAYRGIHVTSQLRPDRAVLDDVIDATLSVLTPS